MICAPCFSHVFLDSLQTCAVENKILPRLESVDDMFMGDTLGSERIENKNDSYNKHVVVDDMIMRNTL